MPKPNINNKITNALLKHEYKITQMQDNKNGKRALNTNNPS